MKKRVIKIFGWTYKIDKSKNSKQLDGAIGQLSPCKTVLHIAKDACLVAQESILIHEMVEALNFHLDLNLDHRKINLLEIGIHTVLKDNGIDLSKLVK